MATVRFNVWFGPRSQCMKTIGVKGRFRQAGAMLLRLYGPAEELVRQDLEAE